MRQQRLRLQAEQKQLLDRFHQLQQDLAKHKEALEVWLPRAEGTLRDRERNHILRTNWVIGGKRGAAAVLGLKRTTLIGKLHYFGIVRPSRITR